VKIVWIDSVRSLRYQAANAAASVTVKMAVLSSSETP
jgi:hypothetical protein